MSKKFSPYWNWYKKITCSILQKQFSFLPKELVLNYIDFAHIFFLNVNDSSIKIHEHICKEINLINFSKSVNQGKILRNLFSNILIFFYHYIFLSFYLIFLVLKLTEFEKIWIKNYKVSKICTLHVLLLTNLYNVWAKEVPFMKLKSDAKFEEKLTCGLENDMENLANFHQTTRQSQNWDFDGVLSSKIENVWA